MQWSIEDQMKVKSFFMSRSSVGVQMKNVDREFHATIMQHVLLLTTH